MKYQLTRHSTVASGCLRDACQTLHGNVVPVVHMADGWTSSEETTTAHQWRLAIKRGHGGRAMLWSHDYATT